MPRRSPNASPEAFVRAWQTSATAEEAAGKLGLSRRAAWERARRYREMGIPLVFHGGAKELDVPELKALAASLRRIG